MEEENKVIGGDAEALENDINLESEDFNFCYKNKEEAEKDIEETVKDIDAFMETLLADVPGLSEEELNADIEELLGKMHSAQTKEDSDSAVAEKEKEPVKKVKSGKVTLRVLFAAAVVALVSVSVLFVTGTRHNISIENGFASFARDTVQVVFFGEGERYISVDSLLTDLEAHGFKDIVFPQEFVTNSDEYKVSVPEYKSDEFRQIIVEFFCKESEYKFCVSEFDQNNKIFKYTEMDDVHTVTSNDICMYVFKSNNGTVLEFIHDGYYYFVTSNVAYSDMIKIAESIK
ncbi:MAG: DUF4367 domain-containing protein [Clostridia bacterium]|nr:DUF4367 domain-containing protein [Clostridia bacterium]